MNALRWIRKWWSAWGGWGLDAGISAGIDSHLWESKFEILTGGSHGC